VNTANAMTLYALVCSGAVTGTELCTDPNQLPLFVTGVTMAQGISMGAPLFGSPADFVATMKGQGMLGPLLTTLGIKPVKFSSESDFAKSIATESKVFSVYAVGVVKGYKRETRVRIHTVVDFRSAPTLANLAGAVTASLTGGTSPGASSSATPSGTSASGSSATDPNAIAAALAPSLGGQVLFFHVE
jgi:general secretion pathway protein K